MPCRQQRLSARDVEMIWHFGGCFRHGLLTNLPLNFIDVQNAPILGEIMVNVVRISLCLLKTLVDLKQAIYNWMIVFSTAMFKVRI